MCPDQDAGIFEFPEVVFINSDKAECFESFYLDLIMDDISERVHSTLLLELFFGDIDGPLHSDAEA